MTKCRDKCWCKKFARKEPDAYQPNLIADTFVPSGTIEHIYDGIEKCFERIELIDMAISSDGRIEDFVKQNVEKIHERIDQLESNVDFEKAKELIYQGAQTLAYILKIQSELNALTEMYKALSINVAGLQDRHVRQIDENRKSSQRIDDIETLIDVRAENNEKKPHKCPVCDGKGQWFEEPSNKYHCNSCEGKGIVWG